MVYVSVILIQMSVGKGRIPLPTCGNYTSLTAVFQEVTHRIWLQWRDAKIFIQLAYRTRKGKVMGMMVDMLFLFGVFQSSVWIISVSGKSTYVQHSTYIVDVTADSPRTQPCCVKPNSSRLSHMSIFNRNFNNNIL